MSPSSSNSNSGNGMDSIDEYLGSTKPNNEIFMDFSDSGKKKVAANNILSMFDKTTDSQSHSTKTGANSVSSPLDEFDF
ncbi:hypothetical protein D3C80_1949010 [compost metagenome]